MGRPSDPTPRGGQRVRAGRDPGTQTGSRPRRDPQVRSPKWYQRDWCEVADEGARFEKLVLNNAARLARLVGLDGSFVLSATPWRKTAKGDSGGGCQIDLLYQTKRSACVVEIKRRREIGADIVDEVARKVERLPLRRPVILQARVSSHCALCIPHGALHAASALPREVR